MPAVLAACDALLLTSEREGLNRSVLEAMASGKPVIGTDTRGITDAVGPDEGWIVGHSDTVALAPRHRRCRSRPHRTRSPRRGGPGARLHGIRSATRSSTAYDGLYREALASVYDC